ncbi:hypothetical protein U6A24_09795 [Aquimarina gracilis]|uniref:ABM domain-containing protein n=1 Tax=Aquimarina gracilis TaxID=874422 RepID=A0ABU5ZUS9_9FLAO|nr:hypothetical protein [Aquimarina gracilis]MEB3345754.1 hypothetical protein [Aquimarina gracilis]
MNTNETSSSHNIKHSGFATTIQHLPLDLIFKKMIIRIFKAIIPEELHEEFELKFKGISVPIVKNYKGLISLEIAKPTKWNPNEFIMISCWNKEDDLINFAEKKWNEVHIPKGMEKYIYSCSVDHYQQIDLK